MKNSGWLRIVFFQIVFLSGVFWLLSGPGQPASAHAVLSAESGVQARTGMDSGSCPMKGMKGTLPCCGHVAKAAFCRTSLCDLCLLSDHRQAETPLRILRVPPPAFSPLFSVFAALSGGTPPIRSPLSDPPFPSKPLHLQVNAPLLI